MKRLLAGFAVLLTALSAGDVRAAGFCGACLAFCASWTGWRTEGAQPSAALSLALPIA